MAAAKKPAKKLATRSFALATPCGAVGLEATAVGLVRVCFMGATRVPLPRTTPPGSEGEILQRARCELEEYFAGERRAFTVAVDWWGLAAATDFRLAVWRALAAVGYGQTVTYAELAALAGQTGAARAVGGAMAANPVPIILPCHRVLPAGGTRRHPGGYAGGTATKRVLLGLEQCC